MISFKRQPEDNDDYYKYLWRVGTAIENGTAGCNWSEAAWYINREWDNEYTSSAYRKPVQYAMPFYEHVFAELQENDASDKARQQMDEMYKLKRQFYDQRREYNKILSKDARAEHLIDIISECAKNMQRSDVTETYSQSMSVGSDEAVLCLSDWHYGMTADNVWNTFNTDICKQRVASMTQTTITALKTHKINKLHVLCLGDFAHGACHVGCRVASEELVCDQLMQVSEILAELIECVSDYVCETEVYVTYGNHMRTVQKLEDSIHEDNMEKIIPWYLTSRFDKNNRISVNTSEYGDFILFDCCGYSIFATHGDIDNFTKFGITANTLSTKVYGKSVDYAISGDKHSGKEYDTYGIRVIQVPSLCGSDEYANNHRLYADPGQLLIIFDKSTGRKCTYDISF